MAIPTKQKSYQVNYKILNLPDFLTNEPIGLASQTIDKYGIITINQTTPGITLTIPNPPTNIDGKIIIIQNIGSSTVTIGATVLSTNNSATFCWDGAAWTSAYQYTLPAATTSVLGGVKDGLGIVVDPDGSINTSVSRPYITRGLTDLVGNPDGSTIAQGGTPLNPGTYWNAFGVRNNMVEDLPDNPGTFINTPENTMPAGTSQWQVFDWDGSTASNIINLAEGDAVQDTTLNGGGTFQIFVDPVGFDPFKYLQVAGPEASNSTPNSNGPQLTNPQIWNSNGSYFAGSMVVTANGRYYQAINRITLPGASPESDANNWQPVVATLMGGCNDSNDGFSGLAPLPPAGCQRKALTGDAVYRSVTLAEQFPTDTANPQFDGNIISRISADGTKLFIDYNVGGVVTSKQVGAYVAPPAPTNIGYISSPTDGSITSSTGTGATVPLVDSTNAGLMSPTDKSIVDSLGTAAFINTGTSVGQLPVLLSGGLLPVSVIPPLFINNVYVGLAADRTTQTIANGGASDAQVGDVFKETDGSNLAWILKTLPGSSGGNWVQITNSTTPFSSITGLPTTLVGYGITDAMELVPSATLNHIATFDAFGQVKDGGTLTSITTNILDSLANIMTSTVNGVSDTTSIINSNTLTSATGSITSSVNGINAALTPAVGTIVQPVGFNSSGTLVKNSATYSASMVSQQVSATASQTVFTLLNTPKGNVLLFRNGAAINITSYSAVGTAVTYIPANNGGQNMIAGDNIIFYYSI